MARLERKRSSFNSFNDEADEEAESTRDDGWEKLIDDSSGEPYWYNRRTGAVTWDRPEEVSQLPRGWEELVDDDSGRRYWYHHPTGRSSWERPRG